jgi:hypothetical protein
VDAGGRDPALEVAGFYGHGLARLADDLEKLPRPVVDVDVLAEVADGSVLRLSEEVPRDLDDLPVLRLELLDDPRLHAIDDFVPHLGRLNLR